MAEKSSEELLRDGLAPYADQQKHLLGFLSDWVDQDAFDDHTRALGSVHMYGGKPRLMTRGAFVLGTYPSQGPVAEWLHLAQFMIQLGLVEARKDVDGKVWYRAVRECD